MANKLQIAVKGRVPLITCTTRDIANLQQTLKYFFPNKEILKWGGPAAPLKQGTLYYVIGAGFNDPESAAEIRGKFLDEKVSTSLLLINPPDMHQHDLTMSAGLIPVPQEMMANMLKPIAKTDALLKSALNCLGGLSLKEANDIARYAMAAHGSMTPAGLAQARNELFKPQKGLYPVLTEQTLYAPSPALTEWAEREKKFFLTETDPRLVPRGLMLEGEPGTGKTEAAKYIARMFEVPLYRLDLATTQDKYVGNSAKFLQMNLDTLDQQEPCVVLIDEVEKVINQSSSTYSQELISLLLWWMQTHKTKVLTICTTNDLSKIPPEFYRPGRLDEVMKINAMPPKEAEAFLKQVMVQYGHDGNDMMFARVHEAVIEAKKGNLVTPAQIEAEVKKAVKQLAAAKKKLVFKKSS
ncbi:ATPase domain-containing protein [Rhizobium phage RHph_TM16]|nr:ATPase domain-containing protein [Rhizobium phage RHph_TM16]